MKKLFVHDVERYNIYNALHNQQLWRSTKITKDLLRIYTVIFGTTCDFSDIVCVVDSCGGTVNLKFVLAAVGVCVRTSADRSHLQLQGMYLLAVR